ncbi:MAG: hypothetical protein ACTHK4_01205 [Mycobacteriales bacterium]
MRRTVAATPIQGWVLVGVLLTVVAAGVTKLWEQTAPSTVRILGLAASASASGAGTSGNSGCGGGNGGSNGTKDCGNPGHPITVTGGVIDTLYPGVTGRLRVTVTNPTNQDLTLTNVTPTIGTPDKAGCLASWFAATSFNGSKIVGKLSSAYVDLPFTMLDEPVKQDACIGATVPVSFTATASGA